MCLKCVFVSVCLFVVLLLFVESMRLITSVRSLIHPCDFSLVLTTINTWKKPNQINQSTNQPIYLWTTDCMRTGLSDSSPCGSKQELPAGSKKPNLIDIYREMVCVDLSTLCYSMFHVLICNVYSSMRSVVWTDLLHLPFEYRNKWALLLILASICCSPAKTLMNLF